MNRITNNIHRLKTTGEMSGPFGKVVKISKEEKAKHIHPRRKRSQPEGGIDENQTCI